VDDDDDDDDDGEVDIVYGGLSIEDLPEQFKHIDDGDNDNDDTEFKDPRFAHEFEHETAVSPRELTCLLHKLQVITTVTTNWLLICKLGNGVGSL